MVCVNIPGYRFETQKTVSTTNRPNTTLKVCVRIQGRSLLQIKKDTPKIGKLRSPKIHGK